MLKELKRLFTLSLSNPTQTGFSEQQKALIRLDEHREVVESIETHTSLLSDRPWHINHMADLDDYLTKQLQISCKKDPIASNEFNTRLRKRPAIFDTKKGVRNNMKLTNKHPNIIGELSVTATTSDNDSPCTVTYQWKPHYIHAISLLSASLDLLNKNRSLPLNIISFNDKPLPTHFVHHNELIEQALSDFMLITNEEGYYFKSKYAESSLEVLRYAIHRENENEHLASIDYEQQPSLLAKEQDINPPLNYLEAYLELLEVNMLIINEVCNP
jgi:hypothetical protein